MKKSYPIIFVLGLFAFFKWFTSKHKKLFRAITAIIFVGITAATFFVFKGGVDDEKQLPADTPNGRTIGIFVDEQPNNPENLEQIKIATVTIASDGSLAVNTLSENGLNIQRSWGIQRLRQAIKDIAARPSLKLVSETEEMINGKKALVMKEFDMSKTDRDYLYGVAEVLSSEFGFYTEVEE